MFRRTAEKSKVQKKNVENGSFENGKYFPLAMARVGERLKIAKLKGSESTMYRLISLGLVPGTNVQNSSISGSHVNFGFWI